MSPGASAIYERMYWEVDIRAALPAIHVPTLVLHRIEDAPEANRYLADHITGAEFVQLPGRDHVPFLGDQDSVTKEIERFVRAVQDEETELDRVLATVVFTDIVDSASELARRGDLAWKDLVERHHAIVRNLIARHRGREVDTAGDGFFAAFDGPARAVRCAQQIVRAVRELGLEVRAGVHTGEVRTIDEKIGGMGVVIGARIGAAAAAGEVLVSSTVKDLVVGSGIEFLDRGEHTLKGVPGTWRVYAVA
jgi:class 3 adenylate cyclase